MSEYLLTLVFADFCAELSPAKGCPEAAAGAATVGLGTARAAGPVCSVSPSLFMPSMQSSVLLTPDDVGILTIGESCW